MSSEVVCMALGRVPVGEQRCRFLAVGLSDNTVRIISLDPSVSPQKSSTFFYKSFFSRIYMLQVIFKYSFSLIKFTSPVKYKEKLNMHIYAISSLI